MAADHPRIAALAANIESRARTGKPVERERALLAELVERSKGKHASRLARLIAPGYPEELPIGDEREIPKVSIAEAINIAKLPARDGPSTSSGRGGVGGGSRGGKGFEDRTYDETGFDTTPISRHEWDEARQNIFDRLRRLREQMEDEERETGRCRSCGQALPNLTFGQDSA